MALKEKVDIDFIRYRLCRISNKNKIAKEYNDMLLHLSQRYKENKPQSAEQLAYESYRVSPFIDEMIYSITEELVELLKELDQL